MAERFFGLFFSFLDASESAVRRQTAFSEVSVGSFPSRDGTHMSWKELVILFLTKESSMSNYFMKDCCYNRHSIKIQYFVFYFVEPFIYGKFKIFYFELFVN